MREPAVKPGDLIEVTAERLAYGGDAVARHNGLTVFVPYAAPGDRLAVRVVESKKNYARAVIESIVKPSAVREPPGCGYYEECGGCQLQHITYDAEREAKSSFIRDALERLGKIRWEQEIPIAHAAEYGYRSRAQVKIGPPSPEHGLRVGFNRAGSNTVCDVKSCPVLTPELDAALALLRRTIAGSIADGHSEIGRLRDIEMAAGDPGAVFSPALAGLPGGAVERTIAGLRYRFGADTFFQGNAFLLDTLVSEAMGDYSGELAIDLYAGAGLFALQLARRYTSVIAVESSRVASDYATQNAAANGLDNIRVENVRVENMRIEGSKPGKAPDLLLLDPPRSGAAGAIPGIIEIGARSIVYVSCDPPTLARDLRRMIDAGYVLERVAGIDLFPRTFHIETVAHLRRER